jgi:hypothetical protein
MKSPATRVVLGKLLPIGGKSEDFRESLITDKVRAQERRGVLRILPSTKAGHVQVRVLK